MQPGERVALEGRMTPSRDTVTVVYVLHMDETKRPRGVRPKSMKRTTSGLVKIGKARRGALISKSGSKKGKRKELKGKDRSE